MIINDKLTKQITETKYLSSENTWRYRCIIRFFYNQYENMSYMMYREDVYDELKNHDIFKGYTIDNCKQDLDTLVEWGNLIPEQDTSKVYTVEEFKNKKFRYRLSEYSVTIERMTISLEKIHTEGASLEPTLFEKIKSAIEKFKQMNVEDLKAVGFWWSELNNDFKRLNQNYQDYIGDIQKLKPEELINSTQFLIFKDRLIDYLRDFVKALQHYADSIESIISNISHEEEAVVINKIFEHEKSIPRLDYEVLDEELMENILGKWNSIKKWFMGAGNSESEAVKLFDITNEIIRKITRFAYQIVEKKNIATNRKEEYKRICDIFANCENIEGAHILSSLVFGVFHTRHIKSNQERETESINSGVFDETPDILETAPRVRTYKKKTQKSVIDDKSEEKRKAAEEYIKTQQLEKEIVNSYIKDGTIDFGELPEIKPKIRTTLLKWLSRGISSPKNQSKTDDGRNYEIIKPQSDEMCILRAEDGEFHMPAYKIKFLNKE